MKVCVVLTLVSVSLFFQIQICAAGRKGSGSRDGLRPQQQVGETDPGSLGSCQAQGRGSRTLKNRIIRTKDSIDNGACFADAIVVASIEECSNKCCSYSGDDCDANCDTSIFVHETGEEVNCFLFVCGENDDCKFSYHSGYTTMMLTNHREEIEQQFTTPTTTTAPYRQTTTKPLPTTTIKARPTTTVTWDLQTTTKEVNHGPPPKLEKKKPEKTVDDDSQGCGHFKFQCGSGECYKFSFVCDGIIDCRDNSDETGCDYATTVDTLIATSTPGVRVQPTHQDTANNLKDHSPAAEKTASNSDSSIPEIASSESKNGFPNKHVAGEKNPEGKYPEGKNPEGKNPEGKHPEGSERVVGKDHESGKVSGSDDQVRYKEHGGGLTQELQNKGQERISEPDENQRDGLSLTDLQDDLHALSDTGKDRGGKDQDLEKDKKKVGGKSMSGEYDKDYDGDGMWGYDDDDDRDAEKHLAPDLYGTKYEEEHEAKIKDEDSLKEIGRGKEGKDRQDLDYGTYETSVEDKRKPNGYEGNDGYKKEDATSGEDSSSVQRDNMSYDPDDHGRPVYKAVGRKLDNVQNLPHTRKNGHQKNEDYEKNEHHQMKTSDHLENGRFESSQKGGDKGVHKEKWQTDAAKGGWDGGSYTSESADDNDKGLARDKGLVRDKGDKWLLQRPISDQRDPEDDGEYYNRNQDVNRWPDKEVVSRNRNRGWPENDGRQWNDMKDDEEYGPPSKMKNTGEYEPDNQQKKYVNKWQDRQRRPDTVANHLPKYHQQPQNWQNDHRGRRPEYNRDNDYIGRGENPHQFWNQYKNEQLKAQRRPVGNNADAYQYSANDYDNTASSDDQNHEETEEIPTTEPPHKTIEVQESTTIVPTTSTKPDGNSSVRTITQLSGNVTETPKKTFSNNTSNKNGSSHKPLFKKKSSLSDKSLTSAILPLAFGLLITVLLLLLVGCRLRQVNRRLRYGRLKTNVAEADYLINGMYL